MSVQCELLSVYGITDNDPTGNSVSIGEAQLSIDVTVLSATTASLVFANSGPDDNSAAKLFFDYSGPADINLGLVGTYDENGDPGNWIVGNKHMPGANSWFHSDLGIKAPSPPSKNGITPSKSPLEVILSYDAGSFDILEALGTADFRIGIHLISIGPYSESFINNIPESSNNIPQPSTALVIGFIALSAKSYRKIFCV